MYRQKEKVTFEFIKLKIAVDTYVIVRLRNEFNFARKICQGIDEVECAKKAIELIGL